MLMRTCPKCGLEYDIAEERCLRCGTPQTPLPRKRKIEPGALLGKTFHYKLESLLGKGKNAEVWLAKDLKMRGGLFALKALKTPIAKIKKEALRACQSAAKIAETRVHPNLARIFSFETDEEFAFFVSEYVKGATLESLLKKRKKLTEDEVLWVAREACLGLLYLHQTGLSHGALALSNMILSESPKNDTLPTVPTARSHPHQCVRLADWVISIAIEKTASKTVSKTPAKMIVGDMRALGGLLYNLLTGKSLPSNLKDLTLPKGASPLISEVLKICMAPPAAIKSDSAGRVISIIERGQKEMVVLD